MQIQPGPGVRRINETGPGYVRHQNCQSLQVTLPGDKQGNTRDSGHIQKHTHIMPYLFLEHKI